MYGIPNMKLDKEQVVLRRIELMEAEGVKFVCNTEVGENYPAEKLLKEFDAVVLCTGATKPRDLPVEGRELKGVHFAMEFLTAQHQERCSTGHKNGNFISADRQGCHRHRRRRHRHRLRRHLDAPRLPEPGASWKSCRSRRMDRAPDNPWPEWPKVYRLDYGQEEAAAKFGADPRVYLTTAKKFDGRRQRPGQSSPHRPDRVGEERQGPVRPEEVPGTEQVLPAQLVLLAMGFLGPEQPLLDALGVERDPRSNVKAEYEKYATSIKGVFAAGDCRRGQSLVVWAFNEGRGAARECDRYLMGHTDLP